MGKHTLFKPPFGWFMRWMGGVAVDRRANHNVVDQMAKELRERESLILAVPAEGTRKYVDYWKSGFYYIAQQAGVPIILGFLDYEKKVGGFGPALMPSGDIRADMDKIREFYKDIKGKRPEYFGRIRLRAEEEGGEGEKGSGKAVEKGSGEEGEKGKENGETSPPKAAA